MANQGQLEAFLWDLLSPEMYGHAVTAEIRDRARKLLGLPAVETTMNQGVTLTDNQKANYDLTDHSSRCATLDSDSLWGATGTADSTD